MTRQRAFGDGLAHHLLGLAPHVQSNGPSVPTGRICGVRAIASSIIMMASVGPVRVVCFHIFFCTASRRKVLRDRETRRRMSLVPRCTLTGHKGSVSCVAWGSGDVLASCSFDEKDIILWSKDGSRLRILKGHSASVCSIATLGNVVASGSCDKTVQLWDISNGNPVGCPHLQGENVSALAASSNKLAVAVGANVKLHATPQARVQRVQHFLTCTCMDKSYSTCHAVCTPGQ